MTDGKCGVLVVWSLFHVTERGANVSNRETLFQIAFRYLTSELKFPFFPLLF